MSDEPIAAPEATPPVDQGTPAPSPVTPPVTNWLLEMPEDLQNSETLNKYKTQEDLARAHIEVTRMVGDRVKVPTEDAPQDERDKFYNRLGRPESPEGYEFTKVELPQELPFNPAELDKFRPIFHQAGLTKKQADIIQSAYLNNLKTEHEQLASDYNKSVGEQMDALKTRWGAEFDGNRTLALNTFASFANPNLKATVEKEGWGNHPDFVDLFHRIGVATREDVMRNADNALKNPTQDRIKQIESDPAYLDPKSPNRKDLLAERDRLYQVMHPETKDTL
jgi:hypothetical protein